jgi:Predicted nucleic acid-binding protein, contains PIN domain
LIEETAVFFIDTNVPMYAVGTEHELKAPCIAVLEAIARGGIKAITDAEILQEILYRYTALGRRNRAVEVCELFLKVVPDVLPVTVEIMKRAIQLHLQFTQLQARDSLHTSVMLENKISHIISADQHFDGIPGIVRHDPRSLSFGSSPGNNDGD